MKFGKKDKKLDDKELLESIKEEIKANIDALKDIDGMEQKDLYNEKIRNIKVLNDAMKDLRGDIGKLDMNMLINTLIVSGVSLLQCVVSWKEEPLKPFTTVAKMWFIRPKSKF